MAIISQQHVTLRVNDKIERGKEKLQLSAMTIVRRKKRPRYTPISARIGMRERTEQLCGTYFLFSAGTKER